MPKRKPRKPTAREIIAALATMTDRDVRRVIIEANKIERERFAAACALHPANTKGEEPQ